MTDGRGPRSAVWGIAFWVLVLADVGKRGLLLAAGPTYFNHDAIEYWHMGLAILRGDWSAVDHIPRRTPGYPLFLSLIVWLSGPNALLVTFLLQHLASLLAWLLAALAAYRWTRDMRAAVAAYAVGALGLAPALFANHVLSESLFVLLLMLHLVGLFEGQRTGSTRYGLGVGLVAAAATMVRPLAALLVAFELPMLMLTPWLSRRCRLLFAAAIGLSCYLPLGAWCLRNGAVHGTGPFLCTNSDLALYWVCFETGYNELPMPEDLEMVQWLGENADMERFADRAGQTIYLPWILRREGGLSSVQADRVLGQAAWTAIARSPTQFLGGAAGRFLGFWWDGPAWSEPYAPDPLDPGLPQAVYWRWPPAASALNWLTRTVYSPAVRNRGHHLYVVVSFMLLAWGLWGPDRLRLAMGLTVIGYFALVTAVFALPQHRYLMVIEPVIALLVAVSLFRPARFT